MCGGNGNNNTLISSQYIDSRLISGSHRSLFVLRWSGPQGRLPQVRWSDGMRCCWNDGPGLCLFCCSLTITTNHSTRAAAVGLIRGLCVADIAACIPLLPRLVTVSRDQWWVLRAEILRVWGGKNGRNLGFPIRSWKDRYTLTDFLWDLIANQSRLIPSVYILVIPGNTLHQPHPYPNSSLYMILGFFCLQFPFYPSYPLTWPGLRSCSACFGCRWWECCTCGRVGFLYH